MSRTSPMGPERPRSLAASARWLPAVLAFLLACGFVAWDIRREFVRLREDAQERNEAVANLQAMQISAWLDQHLRPAAFMKDSQVFAGLYRSYDDGDPDALGRLLARATELRKANDEDAVTIVDAGGRVLAQEHDGEKELSDETRQALQRAIALSSPMHTSVYRRDGYDMPIRMDVVVPLLATGTPARAALILRLDPHRRLYGLLDAWPGASSAGDSVLWEHDGTELINLSELPGTTDSIRRFRVPDAASQLPASAIRPVAPVAGEPMVARDVRGIELLASARPVERTNWWLVTSTDLSGVQSETIKETRWIALTALMAVAAAILGTRQWSQRQALARSRHELTAQQDRLRALDLLEAIADSSSDAIFAKDLDGQYIFCNRAAAAAMSRPRADVVGKTDSELWPPETADERQLHDLMALKAGRSMTFEESTVTPDQTRIELCARGPLISADGRPIGLVGVSRDVTEIRDAERMARETAAHYRTVIESLSEGIIACAPDGVVLSCNPAAERILGSSEAELQTTGVSKIGWVPVDDEGRELDYSTTPLGKVLAGASEADEAVLPARGPSGQVLWFDVRAVAVRSPDTGQILSFVASFSDITPRKRLEDELTRHRDKLERLVTERTEELNRANDLLNAAARFNRAITDAIPGRVSNWDAELRCRFANRAYVDAYVQPPRDIVGQSAVEIFGAERMSRSMPRLLSALAGEPQHFDRAMPEGDRTTHEQVHYLPEQGPDGHVHGLYIMAFDITELKRAESLLREANERLARARDKAEEASRAKSTFLANMSHEIRTPMNAIIGLTHLMSRDARESSQRDRLHKVSDAAQHLLQIINDILDLSKIEAGKMTLEIAPFALDPLLSRACELVAGKAREKGLELLVDGDDVPAKLTGDSTRLLQGILNLLSNAVKFTERGWVRLRTRVEEAEAGRVLVRFEVQDTGPGIAPARQAALFRPFEQGDDSMTRRHGGTGLGLALTRQFARLMGGEAGLQSTPGEGSCFWFTAWLGRTEEPLQAPVGELLSGMSCLVVDDLPEATDALSAQLGALGLRVDTASDGRAAQRLVESATAAGSPYDIVLVDWRMTPTEGVETLGGLRALLREGAPPCVLVTACDDSRMYGEATQAGFDALLLKPVTASSLRDTLARLLRRQPPIVSVAEPEISDAERSLRKQHAGKRVLLAEDNPVNREVAGELLRAAGLSVQTATDGASAVEAATSQSFDIILMDMRMPGVDGLSATRALRERLGPGIPIIAMTANAFGDDREACIRAGMNGHVPKPVDPNELYTTVLHWLSADRAGSTAPEHLGRTHPSQPARLPLIERLNRVPGYDVRSGMRMVANHPEMLRRALASFCEMYEDGEPLLLILEDAHDIEAAREACHSLKGAALSVGATELGQAADDLEFELADEADERVRERAEHVDRDLRLLVAMLRGEINRQY